MDVSPLPPQETHPSRVWLWRLLAALIILGAAGIRVGYLASDHALDLSPDEAHYWDWSRHLDWSYYSKGPLVALLIRGSCALTEPWTQEWTGQGMLSVRLPAVVCGSLLLLALYILTAQVFRRENLALGLVALASTVPLIAAGSSLITIDAPYTCCWAWALVFGYQAVFRERWWAWLLAGLMVALGILAKYTMVLWIPSLALFFLFTPGFRRFLWSRGFWSLLMVGALGGLPILYWNYQHDWVSWKHLKGHAGLQEISEPVHWLGPLRYLGLQFALLLGYWFIVWAAALWMFRPWKEGRTDCRYLWWMSAPMFLFFLVFSFKNGGGEPNWPVTAYLSGLVLGVGWLAQQLQAPAAWYRRSVQFWLLSFCGIGLGLTILTHQSSLAYPWLIRLTGPATAENPIPLRRLDPTCRLQGWRTLAAEVDRLRLKLQEQGVDPVLAGNYWNLPGQIGFYCQGRPIAYSLGPVSGDRHSQYDFWRPNPVADTQPFLGQTFILVGSPSEQVQQAFDRIDPPRVVTHRVNGQPVNQWVLTVGHGFRGFSPNPTTDREY